MDSPSSHHRDLQELVDLARTGAQIVLPLTTVIETGNAIAKVHADRNRYIDHFVKILRSSIANESPWLTVGETTNIALFSRMVNTGDVLLSDLMIGDIGTGDAAIIAEVAELRTRIPSATPVRIWTHDDLLRAYS